MNGQYPKPTPCAIAVAIPLAKSIICALALLMAGAFLFSKETHAAWKNVCPSESLCTNATITDDKFPFETHIHMGDSHVLKSPRPLGSAVQVVYLGPPAGVTTERVIKLPAGNGQGTPVNYAYYERADGNRLYVDGASATAVDANGRSIATTYFVDVFAYGMMGIATPLTRVGTWQAIASIYFNGTGALRTTNDDGNTWRSSTMPVKPIPGDSLYASPFESALWVVGSLQTGSTSAIFATSNRGLTWTRVDDGAFTGQGGKFISLAFSDDATAAGGQAVYATTTNGLVVSRDKGSSWTPVAIPITETLTTVAVVRSQTPNWIVVGTERRVLVSKDAGSSWSPLSLGLAESKQYVFVSAQRLFTGNKAGWYECIGLACDGEATKLSSSGDGTVPVTEYFHAGLGHYYLSSNSGESSWLDRGGGGGGWTRTGLSFRAWATGGNPIAREVCRYYGSPTLGPNSHFFSISANECEGLHQLQRATPASVPRWNHEGIAFFAETVDPLTGQCRSGRSAVYRAYNNGSTRGIDSNHRFVPRVDELSGLVSEGWSREGIAFCSIQ